MYTQKFNEWVEKYGLANVKSVCNDIDCMKSLTVRYGWELMVECTEDSLNEIEL